MDQKVWLGEREVVPLEGIKENEVHFLRMPDEAFFTQLRGLTPSTEELQRNHNYLALQHSMADEPVGPEIKRAEEKNMETKPGYKTTEFWLSGLAIAVASTTAALEVLQNSGNSPGWVHGAIVAAGMLSAVLTVLGYGKARVQLKIAQMNADK